MHPTVCPLMWNIIVVWYRLKGWQNTTSAILAFASSEQKFMQGVHQTIQKARQRLWLHQVSRIDSHDLFCACLLVNVCLARVCLGGRIRSETCSHYNIVARLCGNGKLLPTSNFFHWLQLPFFFFFKSPKSCDNRIDEIHPVPRPLPYFQISVEHEESWRNRLLWVRMSDKQDQQNRTADHVTVLLTSRIQLVRKTQQSKGLHRMGTYDYII